MAPLARALGLEQGERTERRGLPGYLVRTYTWAYLDPRILPWLDRPSVVSAILWGQANRLVRVAVAQFEPGSRVLQAACVYGSLLPDLARRLGPSGHLDVIDVSRLQLENARRKLERAAERAPLAPVRLLRGDLADPASLAGATYDGVDCFFLLHEVPESARLQIVDGLLHAVRPGGSIVFTDYHRPAAWHPLRPVMSLVFRHLEPHATSLFDAGIEERSALAGGFTWTRGTVFGGLYQRLVGVRQG